MHFEMCCIYYHLLEIIFLSFNLFFEQNLFRNRNISSAYSLLDIILFVMLISLWVGDASFNCFIFCCEIMLPGLFSLTS